MAADTFSATLGVLEQGTGNNNNTWGALLNTGVFDQYDKAIAGRNALTVTGGTLDLEVVTPPAGPSSAIHAILDFTGTLTSNQSVAVPNLSKLWAVRNATTGAFTLTFKTPGGAASTALPRGGWCWVWCDGANNIYVGLSTSLRDIQWLGADGTVSLPGISFAAEPNSGFYRFGAGALGVSILGVQVANFGASGMNVTGGFTVNGIAPLPTGTEVDYAGIFLPTGWYFCDGAAVSRTTDATLFAAITATVTGNSTNASPNIQSISQDLRGLGLEGAFVEGTGIATGTTITSIGLSTLSLSANVSGSTTGMTVRILPYGQGDASTTFNIPDRRGRVVFARDDMNGSAAGRLSKNTAQGIDGTRLNGTGGEQSHTIVATELPAHAHQVFINEFGGHSHLLRVGVGAIGGPSGMTFDGGSSFAGNDGTAIVANTTGIRAWDGATLDQTSVNSTTNAGINEIPPGGVANRIIKR